MVLCYKWCCVSTFLKLCICTLVALFSVFKSTTARVQVSTFSMVSQVIVVDPSGQGDFKTIQAAIDSIPSNNNRWTCVNIKQGIYREKVRIGQDKPYIYLKGEGMENTIIEWNDYGLINTSSTFTSEADYTAAMGIKFVNSYNSPPNTNQNPLERAVAAQIQGDKSAFYECGFFGMQDTLWDVVGRHYFKNCTIEGAIDFIFGAGQSLYESCIISVAAGTLNGTPGYITAQGRENPDDTSGFMFTGCNIVGNGKAYLGRPWREYARVLFYNTQMSEIVLPQGWFAWKSAGKEEKLTVAEYDCGGSGANNSMRVEWEKKLSEEEVKQLTSTSFIDDHQGWIDQVSSIMGANL